MNSIGDLIDEGYTLRVYCEEPCWNGADVDLEALAGKLGRDHSYLHDDIVRYFRCSKCGSKNVTFRLGTPKNWRARAPGVANGKVLKWD